MRSPFEGAPMRIEILNTGTELLLGNTLNTHGAWFGRELFMLGLRITRQTTVPDGDAIREALEEAVMRSDAVIVTGGLGPTSDDLTREITGEVLGLELITDEAALRSIENFFAMRGRPMADANRKQALSLVGADVLPNANGTAPGVYVPPRLNGRSNCAVFLLPGPPRELYPMFHDEVAPRLKALSGLETANAALELKFTGIGESDFHDGIDQRLSEVPGLEYGYCAHIGEVDLRLIGNSEALAEGRKIALERFESYLISDDGSSLEKTVVGLMAERGMKLATAESCTGGLISHRITNVPGSSEVFTHGFVTYANEAKIKMLGVSAADIELHGAVSETVARQMAEGALHASGACIAVAVTGIAGPGGGSEDKPVGTAWLAVAVKGGETTSFRTFHPRNRRDFKLAVSQAALEAVRKRLNGIS
ncbi:MAG: competence/damage-inducible protein A [Luteolibacter sp.]